MIAHTQTLDAIIDTMQRCHNCGLPHRTWQCPEIHKALREPILCANADNQRALVWDDHNRPLCGACWLAQEGVTA